MKSVSLQICTGASLTATVLPDASGAIARARNLAFSTALPGGYIRCTFDCDLSDPSAWDVALGRFIKLHSSLTPVFEGKIEDISYKRDRATGLLVASVSTFGPWERAKKITEAANYVAATSGRTAITNALGEMADISTDMSMLLESDTNINNVTYDESVADVIEDVCKYGTVNDLLMYFAFWETPQSGSSLAGPRAHTWARDLTTPHWRFTMAEIGQDYTDSLGECFNAVVASYNGGANVTAEATDATSQGLYGERQKPISVETQTLSVAEQARDVYLAAHKDPTPLLESFSMMGTCRDGAGVPRPVALVRAGDVGMIEDWLNGYTFVIGATDCKVHDSDPRLDVATITPENKPKTLSAMLGAITS